ncbi:hypothetical protein AGABI1DRAFT_86600 [Agaricus bisporus var. burnettii JB137-S8]|uniref:alcohol dehydrogenase n=1 Tax=Agaricus bisporus var. burnettii (strain JB137-S8 / ATCC MYA-4627 / FGSC 10392) TaxID=597362 RepID=K5WPM2_AGABU|nr:uncharacterized protein AGABI1DRAFT_86600 [Agaricus bisporus var. burnettii JB137-S8]EKM77296.1 hypothetical protein AGABI1DRAFT_86600 [Agaricus bisporus var. burnettii JB137-S8]
MSHSVHSMSSQKTEIPKVQKAAIVQKSGARVEVRSNVPVKQPEELGPGECLVKMHCTGVCHTDLHAAMGDWPIPTKAPLIGGHEGVGEIVAIGENTTHSPVKIGDRVGIKWIAYSCLECEPCRKSFEQNCENVQISGYTIDGTFQQYVVSYVHCVTPIPEGLDSAAAASLLCAGLTVYRALKYSETGPGDWIVLPGAGGGLGHLVIQYAKYMGRRVIAIDGGEEKRKLCLSLGADHWIDFKTCKDVTAEIKRVTGGKGAHATVVTTASSSGYSQAIDYLRPNGRLMAVGLPAKTTLDADIFWTVYKSITIHGSYVGNRQDAIECVDIAATGAVKVHYAEKHIDDLEDVYSALNEGKIAGRIVLALN